MHLEKQYCLILTVTFLFEKPKLNKKKRFAKRRLLKFSKNVTFLMIGEILTGKRLV